MGIPRVLQVILKILPFIFHRMKRYGALRFILSGRLCDVIVSVAPEVCVTF